MSEIKNLRQSWCSSQHAWCLLTLMALLAAGCSPSSEPTDASVAKSIGMSLDAWDAIYISGVKVGHVHLTIDPVSENGQELLSIASTTEITVERFGGQTTQRVQMRSIVKPTGELVRFKSEVSGIVTHGIVKRGGGQSSSLEIKTTTQAGTEQSELAWDSSWGGLFAAELSMLRQPMRPGEKRTVHGFVAAPFNQKATIHLEAIGTEEIEMASESERLLKLSISIVFGPGQQIDSYAWTDDTGNVRKSLASGLEMATYRTTREQATSRSRESLDLGRLTTIPVRRSITDAHRTKKIVYDVQFTDGDPTTLFPACGSQQVSSTGPNRARVTVRAIRPLQPVKLPSAESPVPEDLAPNSFIQSDDPVVKSLAQSVAADQTDSWTVATALESMVHRKITTKDFSQSLATAADVARNFQGDCTEHAVLLAAVCRARKIPARVAIGLVYYPSGSGFAYHMWNEVWIADRWVPLDATLGQHGIGAAHLKLADSSLSQADALSVFLPVFHVLGKLTIEIESVE